MKIRNFLFTASILSTFNVFGVKGSHRISIPSVEESSCLILTKYDDLAGKEGVCTGTLIGNSKILTAKHCLFHKPSHIGKFDENPISRPFKFGETVDTSKMTIKCGENSFTPQSFKIHPRADIGVINISSKEEVLPLSIASHLEVDTVLTHPDSAQCGIFGFGLNSINEMRNFEGVSADTIEPYTVNKAFVEIEMDSDFKNLSFYYANSMLNTFFMNSYFFPKLYTVAKRYKYPVSELERALGEFMKALEERGLNENSIYKKDEGPRFKALFLKKFKEIYTKVYTPITKRIIAKQRELRLPLHRLILNVENDTSEKAGMDYGDSGGAFACQFNDEWKIVGVNSRILLDSNRGYIPRPWEPMHFVPDSRRTKNGEATPLSSEIKEWILQ